MSSDEILRIEGLSKRFKIYRRSRDRLKELFSRKSLHRNFSALENISFKLGRGLILGIIGENGSGKSTLLKLIAGILLPDAGQIWRGGKITGLLELGTGFNPELSGRQNIYLNGIYLGMSRKQLQEREAEIIEFSELGQFINEPLKNYSSGMAMRLAFAVAIHADPQCFIIDEALSVGDIRFQQKCFDRIRSFRKDGGSILFVSHDMNAIKLLCDEAMLLHQGKMRCLGDPDDAVNMYNEIMAAHGRSGQGTGQGYGNADVHFNGAFVENEDGSPCGIITAGSPLAVRFSWICQKPVRDLTFGITIRDRFGQDVFGTNGALLHQLANIEKNGQAWFRFPAMNIGAGIYTVNLAAHTGTTHLENCFHWWDNAAVFEVVHARDSYFGGHTKLDVRLDLGEVAAENCKAPELAENSRAE